MSDWCVMLVFVTAFASYCAGRRLVLTSVFLLQYDPSEASKLYVRMDSSVSSQGNMSAVDCEREDWEAHPLAATASYREVVLEAGDAIFIPAGMWHYVRSLTTSISVNYWF